MALAAVVALMAAGFVAGAIVYNGEPEHIEVPGTGLTLILPDTWKGKYGYETQEGYLGVYLLSARADQNWNENGYLFWINSVDAVYPMDSDFAARQTVIASTSTITYFLIRPSDVQYNPENTAVAKEYLAMTQEIGNIQILLSNWLRESSVNAENWVEGMVCADYIEKSGVVKTVTCDERASAVMREMFQSKACTQEMEGFESDLEIKYDGLTWQFNSLTGQIMLSSDVPYGDVLSEEELQTVLTLLEVTPPTA